MTEREKMLSGMFYVASDPELAESRQRARKLLNRLNTSADMTDEVERKKVLQELIGPSAQTLYLEPPFFCDYGVNIELGQDVYINFNCTILDCAKVKIGDGTQIGPNVQIYTATHPLNPKERLERKEFARPISIGKNVWIGGGAIILPGISIGDGAVVGAGSVVTHDIAALGVAVGNPARVKRQFYEFKPQPQPVQPQVETKEDKK